MEYPSARTRLLRIYEHRISGDTFVVLDPQLRLEAIDEVQRQVIAMLGGGASGGGASAEPAAGTVAGGRADFDVIIRGGTVVDGTGQPARLADVAVRDGRIAAIGALDPRATVSTTTIRPSRRSTAFSGTTATTTPSDPVTLPLIR